MASLGRLGEALLWAIALLAFANVVAWSLLRLWPRLLISENERLQLDYLARFEGELRRFIPEWFDIDERDWPEFRKEYSKGETGAHVYDPFVEFKHPLYSGRFLNVHPAGFRHGRDQGAWPPQPEYCNIFFFGGSTTLNVGPDWTCIPSYLQEVLNRRAATAKPVRTYNFGRGSYFSTQERILFQQTLLSGVTPDVAVFLDGVNDLYFFNGLPATSGLFQQALDQHNRELACATKVGQAEGIRWQPSLLVDHRAARKDDHAPFRDR